MKRTRAIAPLVMLPALVACQGDAFDTGGAIGTLEFARQSQAEVERLVDAGLASGPVPASAPAPAANGSSSAATYLIVHHRPAGPAVYRRDGVTVVVRRSTWGTAPTSARVTAARVTAARPSVVRSASVAPRPQFVAPAGVARGGFGATGAAHASAAS